HYRPGVAVEVVWHPLLEGDSSSNLRVLRTSYQKPRLEMLVEGRPDRSYQVRLFTPWRATEGEGVKLVSTSDHMSVVELSAPPAVRTQMDKAGYVRWTARVELLQ